MLNFFFVKSTHFLARKILKIDEKLAFARFFNSVYENIVPCNL